ncbi:MAG: hypothetical protein AAGJ81_03140 [Verrucomicrobiota bacterium]
MAELLFYQRSLFLERLLSRQSAVFAKESLEGPRLADRLILRTALNCGRRDGGPPWLRMGVRFGYDPRAVGAQRRYLGFRLNRRRIVIAIPWGR